MRNHAEKIGETNETPQGFIVPMDERFDRLILNLLGADEDNYDPVDDDGMIEPCMDEPNEYESDPFYSIRW